MKTQLVYCYLIFDSFFFLCLLILNLLPIMFFFLINSIYQVKSEGHFPIRFLQSEALNIDITKVIIQMFFPWKISKD